MSRCFGTRNRSPLLLQSSGDAGIALRHKGKKAFRQILGLAKRLNVPVDRHPGGECGAATLAVETGRMKGWEKRSSSNPRLATIGGDSADRAIACSEHKCAIKRRGL